MTWEQDASILSERVGDPKRLIGMARAVVGEHPDQGCPLFYQLNSMEMIS